MNGFHNQSFSNGPNFLSLLPPAQPKSSSFLKIIIGVIVLIIAGGGISLATYIWDPMWNPFRPSPEKVIEQMRLNMEKVKTFHAEAKISLEGEGKQTGKETIAINKVYLNYKADSDITDPANPKLAGDLEIASETEGMQISLGIGIKTIGKTSYFNLTKIPTIPLIPWESFSNLKNQWIKIDKDTFKSLMGEYYTTETEKQLEEAEKKQAKLKEEVEKIIKEKKFYDVKEKLSDEKIENRRIYRYLLVLKKEEVISLITELYERVTTEYLGAGYSEGFSEDELQKFREELKKQLNEFFEKIGEITAEVWIGQKDKLLHKVRGEKEIDLGGFGKSVSIEGKMKIKAEVDFSNFNQPVKIEAPEESKGLDEILRPIIQMSLMGAQLKAQDAKIKADMSRMRVAAEVIYQDNHSSYLTVSCQKDKEIQTLCESIKEVTGAEPVIYQSKDKYCAYVKLTSENTYFCVDSQGPSVESSINPGKRGYCDGITFVCPNLVY